MLLVVSLGSRRPVTCERVGCSCFNLHMQVSREKGKGKALVTSQLVARVSRFIRLVCLSLQVHSSCYFADLYYRQPRWKYICMYIAGTGLRSIVKGFVAGPNCYRGFRLASD